MALPAQSTPGFVTGQIPTAAGWNEPFAGKLDIANVGAANGVAPLDENGLVPTANLPANYPVETGTIFGDFTTVNASPVTIPNLPTIPLAGGKVSLQGQIGAYDVSTGDTATWNIALVVKRVPESTNCATVGDTTPSLFAAEGTLQSVAADTPPTLAASTQGPIITVAGLSVDHVIYDYNFSFTETSIS
jgi:hypothetical protein